MATIARTDNVVRALVILLGAAVFLNYVDRGAMGIAAPLMKGELGLSEEAYGVAFSAFFWIYAPVQFFAGWLCDRFSVYKLMSAGILLWAGSTFLMGFAGGFASLLVLRIMLGVGESISFPGSSKIIARHVPPERRGVANAAVAAGIAHWTGNRNARRRPDPRPVGLARDFLRLRNRDASLAGAVACSRAETADDRPSRRWGASVGPFSDYNMAALVDVDRPCPGQLLLLFPACLAALVPDQGARLLHWRNDVAGDAGLCRPGSLRTQLWPFLRLVDALRPVGSRMPALDDGRKPVAGRSGDPWPRIRSQRRRDRHPAVPRRCSERGVVAQSLCSCPDVCRSARIRDLGRRTECHRQFVRASSGRSLPGL